MKFFWTKPEMIDEKDSQEILEKIQELEDFLTSLRTLLGEHRTALTNADKKLQQFQDTIYAMLIEEERPARGFRRLADDDDDQRNSYG